jgi:hypothetical protein
MGKKNSRVAKTEKQLARDGIKFVTPNNKTLRLFFESQFHKDMDMDDFYYLNHIFEVKTHLYYNYHYNRSNLMDINTFLHEQLKTLIDDKFSNVPDIQLENTGVIDKVLTDMIQFTNYKGKRLCLVNDNLDVDEKFIEGVSFYNINDEFIEEIGRSEYMKLYIKQNSNTSLVAFILLKVLSQFKHSIKKLKVYQVGVSLIDESTYLILAQFMKDNPGVESLSIRGKLLEDYREIDNEGLDISRSREDSFMVVDIRNKTHIFTLYDTISHRHNLLELRLFVFLHDYSLVLIANALKNNPDIRILEVKNLFSGSGNPNPNELDFTCKYYNELGDNIKDEIYIFFNYVSTLESLEKLIIVNFFFNSDINYFACEIAKCLKKLRVLILEQNQAIISNDAVLAENFQLSNTNLERLNLGLTYFNMIRRFDLLINKDTLRFLDIGVLDYVSLSSFLKFVENTNLEKIRITLNKPCEIESLKFLMKSISQHVFNMKHLRSITFSNTYTDETINAYRREIETYLTKFFLVKMKSNKTIRKINLMYRSKNISAFLLSGYGYIKETFHDACYPIIYCLDKRLRHQAHGGSMVRRGNLENVKIKQMVLKHLYVKYRKISI